MTIELEATRAWEICRELIGFDTTPDRSNVAAAEWAASLLDAAGWTVRLIRDQGLGADKASVIAWAGPAEPGGLLLSGHLDVVPWATQPGWSRSGLELWRDDTRMYGRGVADMKGFLAGCLDVAERLDRSALKRPVVCLLTCDEEPGCLGIERQLAIVGELLRPIPCPREAVIGEPTSWRVFGAHRGHVRVPIRIQGRGGHSSRPDLGVNAIDGATEALLAVRGLALEAAGRVVASDLALYPEHPAVPFNAGTIRGGCAINMIAEQCELAVGFRPARADDVTPLVDELRQRVRGAVEHWNRDATVEFGEMVVTPPLEPGEQGPVAQALRAVSGAGEFLGAPYATDAAHLQQLGITCYIWGPGEIEQAHQANESLALTSFASLPGRLEAVVHQTCTSGGPG